VSYRVLVIPEDPTYNGYILRPLVEAILAEAGRPKAKVQILTNPRMTGYDHAKEAISGRLVDSYAHWDLWIFVPDADRAGAEAMRLLEQELQEKGVTLLCCPAQPEVETYACAAFRSEIPAGWSAARQDTRMKETVFAQILRTHGDPRRPGGGRDLLIEASLRNLPLLFQLCPELATLRDRIAASLRS